MNHPLDAHTVLPAKRKRTLNPKLTSEDNVHEDAVKRRKAQQSTTQRQTPGASKEKVQRRASTPPPSVIELDDDTEMVDEESSISGDDEQSVEARVEVEIEDTGLQEETDEQELGQPRLILQMIWANLIDIQHVSKKSGDLPFMRFFAQRFLSIMLMDGVSMTLLVLQNNVRAEERIRGG